MHLKGADGMDVSGLGFRKALVDTGWVVSLLCTVGLRKQSSRLVGPPFLLLKGFFFCSGQLLAKSYWDLINKWMWLES